MERITDMYMEFRGVRNDEIGAKLIGMPMRQQTALRGEKQVLPGRDGMLLVPTGYQEITVKVDISVPDNDDLPAVKRWLSGSGDLIFGDFPDRAYDALIITPLPMSSVSKRLTGQKFTVTFTCQPFLREADGSSIVATEGITFAGHGDVNAMPLVAVEGSGAETLMINDRSMLLALEAGTPLYIDCDAGTAYTMNGNAMEYAGSRVTVLDDWFELAPEGGTNLLNFTSGITKVTLTPRWRYF